MLPECQVRHWTLDVLDIKTAYVTLCATFHGEINHEIMVVLPDSGEVPPCSASTCINSRQKWHIRVHYAWLWPGMLVNTPREFAAGWRLFVVMDADAGGRLSSLSVHSVLLLPGCALVLNKV